MEMYREIFSNTYKNVCHYIINGEEVIADNNCTLWLNEKHIEKELDHTNLPIITRKFRL